MSVHNINRKLVMLHEFFIFSLRESQERTEQKKLVPSDSFRLFTKKGTFYITSEPILNIFL